MQKVTLFPQSCKGMEDCGICTFVCPKSLFVASEEMNEAGYLPPLPPDDDPGAVEAELTVLSSAPNESVKPAVEFAHHELLSPA